MRVSASPFRPARAQRGFSLVELMVSVVLGLVIVAALSVLFANNSRALQESQKTEQQIENGRYADEYLTGDLRLAGYYGEFNPNALTVPSGVPDPSLTDPASLAASLPLAVQGYHAGINAATASPIPPGVSALLTDLRANSDVLVLRRASTCTAGPVTPSAGCAAMDGNHTYFQTTLCQSQLSALLPPKQFVIATNTAVFTATNPNVLTAPTFLTQRDCATAALTRTFYVRIYYIANNDNPGDGIPTLKLVELGAGGFAAPVPIAEGIDSMQVEYGVDTKPAAANNPAPDFYTPDPGNPAYAPTSGGAAVWPATTPYPGTGPAWHDVTAVKVHLLARNTSTSPGWKDTRTYVLGSAPLGSAPASDNTYGPYNDAYKRHVYTSVIRLENVAGRLE